MNDTVIQNISISDVTKMIPGYTPDGNIVEIESDGRVVIITVERNGIEIVEIIEVPG
jgi:hypothetical protein